MQQRKPIDQARAMPANVALALKLVSKMDLLRLKSIARVHARGLPADVGWMDLMQEAFARVLDGSRQRPEGVSWVAFLAGIMRSLRSEHWRRIIRQSCHLRTVAGGPKDDESPDPTPGAERVLSALQELAAINKLFSGDRVVLLIINGLGDGLSPEQIRAAMSISRTDYDSARKRMRRALLQEGLTCKAKST